jgi:Ca2+-binding RTX toxin-like protein
MRPELLESRQLMSATLNSTSHLLTINGTDYADSIYVTLNAVGDKVIVTENGTVKSFAKTAVNRIKVLGNSGSDVITIDQKVKINAELHAGPTKFVDSFAVGDSIQGGGGNDTLYDDDVNLTVGVLLKGGGGSDTFHLSHRSMSYGGPGDDTFMIEGVTGTAFGEDGKDRAVVAAKGNGAFDGGGSQDTIDFAGFTADLVLGNQSALSARGLGLFSGKGNGSSPVSVFADGSVRIADNVEILKAGSGNDHLYGGSIDNQLVGRQGNDYLNGGAGLDALFGGKGDDYLQSNDFKADFVDGGEDHDRVYGDFFDTIVNVEVKFLMPQPQP